MIEPLKLCHFMDMDLINVHVGEAIEKRRKELKMSKTEFGRRLGVQQQHVNRILDRETMETAKLYKVCQILDYNFFSLFCPLKHQVSAYLSAVACGGDAINQIGDAQLSAEMTKMKDLDVKKDEIIAQQAARIEELKSVIQLLNSNLKDKDAIIELIKERRQPAQN